MFVILSCANSSLTNEIRTIHFEEKSLSLFDSLDFRFIPLETNQNCLIGDVNHVEVFDNRIFVHDLYFSKSIFVFDMNGHFITQIGSIGEGPECFIRPYGFEIDKKNRNIIVNDSDRRRLVFYDLDNYEFVMHKENPFSYTDLFAFNDRLYFFSHYGFEESRNDHHILVTDTLFNPIFKDWKCNFKTYRIQTVSGKQIYSTNDHVFAFHHLQPYIYEIQENECKMHTQLSFEGLTFPTLDPSTDPTSFQYIDELDKSKKHISAYGVYESNDILFIQLTVGKMPYFAIHHKITHASSIFNGADFIESMGLDALILPKGATSNEIIVMITTNQNIDIRKIKVPAFVEIINNMKEESNPILCFMKWKEI